jgi:hypothetical protein
VERSGVQHSLDLSQGQQIASGQHDTASPAVDQQGTSPTPRTSNGNCTTSTRTLAGRTSCSTSPRQAQGAAGRIRRRGTQVQCLSARLQHESRADAVDGPAAGHSRAIELGALAKGPQLAAAPQRDRSAGAEPSLQAARQG